MFATQRVKLRARALLSQYHQLVRRDEDLQAPLSATCVCNSEYHFMYLLEIFRSFLLLKINNFKTYSHQSSSAYKQKLNDLIKKLEKFANKLETGTSSGGGAKSDATKSGVDQAPYEETATKKSKVAKIRGRKF